MTIRPIDELNTMSVEPEEYFGEMNLTKEQIDERIQFTKDANDALLDTMYLMATMGDYGDIDYPYVQRQLEDRWAALIESYVILDDYLMQYTRDYAENFVDATKRHEDNEWYFSEDRALFGAENAANDTLNYKDYIQAIEDGYTHKKWLTENDPKVRDSHRLLHGKEIPIEDYFVVGGALMRFPKDYELAYDAPRETVNCRCSIKYLNKGKQDSGSLENKYRYGTITPEDNRNAAKTIPELSHIVEGDYNRAITAESIRTEMMTSPVGQETVRYLEESEIASIELRYNNQFVTDRAYQQGHKIVLYMKNIPNDVVGAQTLIHETVHLRYGIGGCKKAEAICMAFEKMHLTKRDYITPEEWEYVKRLADAYTEYEWTRGGYGDMDRFEFATD